MKKDRDLVLNDIFVAIIRKYDYDKYLNLNNLKTSNDTRLILPYNLIKYQIPSIVYSQNPRLKKVSLCVSYAYSIQILCLFYTC